VSSFGVLMKISLSTPIERTPRVAQLEGIFDIPPTQRSDVEWDVTLALPTAWNVGLIVGPSGSGKTSVANALFGQNMVTEYEWSKTHSLVDSFPKKMSIKEIVELLSSVGFSSPPAWLRPYHVLSNGEKFRAHIARLLAEQPAFAVVDEFTSVVDRTVAQMGSAAIAKTVRRRQQQFVAVACHYDIVDWLEPDWIYEPATNNFKVTRGSLRRPSIELEFHRVDKSAWSMFKHHHYLDTTLAKTARCWVATLNHQPVAFSSVLHFPHPKAANIKREHRTVCLPDFQGVGIGNAVSNHIASMCLGLGFRLQSQTSHPAMIRYRNNSSWWAMIAKPNIDSKSMPRAGTMRKGNGGVASRLRATFEYLGPAMRYSDAVRMWD
jgi:ABC-type lipoprotein export system ATPase subunit